MYEKYVGWMVTKKVEEDRQRRMKEKEVAEGCGQREHNPSESRRKRGYAHAILETQRRGEARRKHLYEEWKCESFHHPDITVSQRERVHV